MAEVEVELELDQLALRYCRQIIMQTMDHVRSSMREENLTAMKCKVANFHVNKSDLNQTKAIDQVAEDLIVEALSQKFTKLTGVKAYTVFFRGTGDQDLSRGRS